MDVGFGAGGPREPLPLREGVTDCGTSAFEVSRRDPWGWMLRTREPGGWKSSYSFDMGLATAEDIEVGNHYTSTSPNTHFTQLATVSLPTQDGRVSLRDLDLTEIDESGQRTRLIAPDSYLEFIQGTFGIKLPELPRTIS